MCDTCVELDKQIERYRRLSSSITDQVTIDRIKALIDELKTKKIELHRAETVNARTEQTPLFLSTKAVLD